VSVSLRPAPNLRRKNAARLATGTALGAARLKPAKHRVYTHRRNSFPSPIK